MLDVQQLLGVGYKHLGELLNLAGVDSTSKTVPNMIQWGSDGAGHPASWFTTFLITGATLSAPIGLVARRLKNMAISNKEHVACINGENEELRTQIALIVKYFAINENMVDELQQLVTFALSLIDTLSDKAEAAKLFAEIYEERYIALKDKLAKSQDEIINQSVVCELMEAALKEQEELHASHIERQKLEHATVLNKMDKTISAYFDEQDRTLAQMEVYNQATVENLEAEILEQRANHEISLEYFDKELEKKESERQLLLGKLEMERAHHTEVYSTLTVNYDVALKERDTFKQRCEELEKELANGTLKQEVDLLQQKLNLMRGENIEYKASTENAKKQHEELEREIADLEERCFKLKKDNESLNCKVKAHERDDKTWTDEIVQQKQTIEELKNKMEKMQEEHNAERNTAAEKLKELEEDLDKQQTKNLQAYDMGEKQTKRLKDNEHAHKKEVKKLQNQVIHLLALLKKPPVPVKPLLPYNVTCPELQATAQVFQPAPMQPLLVPPPGSGLCPQVPMVNGIQMVIPNGHIAPAPYPPPPMMHQMQFQYQQANIPNIVYNGQNGQ